MSLEVNESAPLTYSDAGGRATLIIRGPWRTATRWNLVNLFVASERVGDGTYPTADVYKNSELESNRLGTSRTADATTFDARGDWLLPGDQLVVVFSNTAPGTLCVANLRAIES